MKGGNVVIFSKNYVTDKPEYEVKFIVFKHTSKGNTLRIQI
jgi:hypothetical protein